MSGDDPSAVPVEQGRFARRSPPEVLLIEDDEIDVMAFRRAASSAGIPWRIGAVTSAEQALVRLRSAPRPRLVVLDLNLPGIGGHELLLRLRRDPDTRDLPVIVLSTSTDERDVAAAFAAHVAGYFAKPIDRDRYSAIVEAIARYWALSEPRP